MLRLGTLTALRWRTRFDNNPEQAGISEFVTHWSRPWDSLMTGAAAAVLEHVAN
jgi:hypothetical protein